MLESDGSAPADGAGYKLHGRMLLLMRARIWRSRRRGDAAGASFERIREELRNGKTPASAVEQGFSHAWITIVDTHVTTIVSAAILFIFGTGPVKGFATTLVFGLLANLFTAVFVSRVIFDWVLGRKQRGEALSI